jgi:lipoprotein-releasing system permease protein
MKATGANNLSIMKIFLYYAGMIVFKGMLIGNAVSVAICILQQQTGIIAIDPEMYYMESVPIEFSWLLVPMNIAMFIISIAILVVPSMLISRIEPVKAIKFE